MQRFESVSVFFLLNDPIFMYNTGRDCLYGGGMHILNLNRNRTFNKPPEEDCLPSLGVWSVFASKGVQVSWGLVHE